MIHTLLTSFIKNELVERAFLRIIGHDHEQIDRSKNQATYAFSPVNLRRIYTASLLGATTLLLSGCVYLRLREVREQLAHFDEYVEVRDDPRPTVVLKTPVLYSSDVYRLTKLQPTTINQTNRGSWYTYLFVKRYMQERTEKTDFNILITMLIQDDKLAEVSFPKRFSVFINTRSLRKVFRTVNDAQLNADDHSATWKAPEKKERMYKKYDFLEHLGQPSNQKETDTQAILFYRYTLKTTHEDRVDLDDAVWFKVTFDKEHEHLLYSECNFGRLGFNIDFAED